MVQCGTIVLYCLNLPAQVCFQTRYTYIAGLTPSPKKPDVTHLSRLIDPVIAAVLETEDPNAAPIKTHYHPEGVKAPARIIPVLADLGGAREACGFYSHAANCFCSYCKLKIWDKDSLNIEAWVKRTKDEVHRQAREWRDAVTITEKNSLGTDFGVRWSPVYSMEHWDPVRYIILGYLHNWLEGVLQHQLRQLWGIGRKSEDVKNEENPDDELFTEDDLTESAQEVSDLEIEEKEWEKKHPKNSMFEFQVKHHTPHRTTHHHLRRQITHPRPHRAPLRLERDRIHAARDHAELQVVQAGQRRVRARGSVSLRAVGERRARPEDLGGGRGTRPGDGVEVRGAGLFGPEDLFACKE